MRYKILRLNKIPNRAIHRDLFNKLNFSFRYPVPTYFTFGGITYRDIMSDINLDDFEVEVMPDDSASQTGLAISWVNPISRPNPNRDFRYRIVFGP